MSKLDVGKASPMSPDTGPLPFVLKEHERTENHWVGTYGDMALLFLYEGAVTDPRHVEVASRVVQRLSSKLGGPCLFFVVLRSQSGRPPDSAVRDAVRDSLGKGTGSVRRAAIAVLGNGFAPSVHRGVITGMHAIVRSKVPLTVHATIAEGLAKLQGAESPGFASLLQALEKLAEPA